MENKNMQRGMIILALLLGAVGGGVLVALVTRAIPRMVRKSAQAVVGTLVERLKEFEDSFSES